MNTPISLEELKSQSNKIIRQPVGYALNAYGFVLYLQIGEVEILEQTTPSGKKYLAKHGEWTFSANGYWKFWNGDTLIIDSRNQEREALDLKLDHLIDSGLAIKSLDFDGEFKITTLFFSNDVKLTIEADEKDKEAEIWALCERKSHQWFIVTSQGIFRQG